MEGGIVFGCCVIAATIWMVGSKIIDELRKMNKDGD